MRKSGETIFGLWMVLLISACSTTASFNTATKYSPDDLKRDASLAWKVYDECHPSLTWYTPYDSVKLAFQQLQNGITDSLTEQQFRFALGKAIASIRCGHTAVRPSKKAEHANGNFRGPYFPLQVKCWGTDSMVVLSNAYRNDSILQRGSVLLSINGRSTGEMLAAMLPCIPADGYHNSFRLQLISNNFPAYYKSVFGLSDSYRVVCMDSAGTRHTTTLYNYDREKDSSTRARPSRTADSAFRQRQSLPPHYSDRHMTIDTAHSLAIMDINTFSPSALKRFYRKSFKTIRENNIQNLAIDLRSNGGGSVINSTRLARYISNHSFRVADTIAAKSLHYPKEVKVKWGFAYKVQRFFTGSKKADGRIHYTHYEKKIFNPRSGNHFDGRVFIITGGQTFSASTLFISPLKGQQNVVIVGEETGGGAYGNSSVNIPDVTLPATGERIRLPLYRMVVNKNLPHDGSGILPDVMVMPDSYSIRHRLDPKMMKVYELIGRNRKYILVQ